MKFHDNAWGEMQMGKFVPLFTVEEYEFRQEAMKKIDSGTMTIHEIIDLQQECVILRSKSIYSQARKLDDK